MKLNLQSSRILCQSTEQYPLELQMVDLEAQAESHIYAARLALDDAVRAEETPRTTAVEDDKTNAESAKEYFINRIYSRIQT